MAVQKWFTKDPQDKLDYKIDAATWLGTDTLSVVAWTVPTGITQVSASNTTTVATIWLSGGTAGTSYEVLCHITTAAGREKDWTLGFELVQQ